MSNTYGRTENEKFCSICGSVIHARAEICPKCGVRQMAPPGSFGSTTGSGKSRMVAALFAILLGGLGIHKFYLGRVGQGILYLLLCFSGITIIISIIEGIIYLTMSDRAFETKYG